MSRRQQVLENRHLIREIAESQNAEGISLFGSVARGEDGPESDCDFIADAKPGTSLFHLGRMTARLERLLGCDVDVVTRNSIPASAASAIAGDEIAL